MTTKITRIETEQYSFPCECCEDQPAPCTCPEGLADEYFVVIKWRSSHENCAEHTRQGVVYLNYDDGDAVNCSNSPCHWCNWVDDGIMELVLQTNVSPCRWQALHDHYEAPHGYKAAGSTPVGQYEPGRPGPCDPVELIDEVTLVEVSQIVN